MVKQSTCDHPTTYWFDKTLFFRVGSDSESAFARRCVVCGVVVELRAGVTVRTPDLGDGRFRTLVLDPSHYEMNAQLLHEDRERVRRALEEYDRLIALNEVLR